MSTGQGFLQELREFLQFLRSLWGVLAGISMLFPLSNVFVTVIPIEDGGGPFQNLPTTVVTVVTILTCIFLTFATFGRRSQFALPKRRARYAWSARAGFVGALATLAVYVLGSNGLYRILITETEGEGGIAVYDGLFASLYVATFALLTRAFLVLAMLEYFPVREEAAATPPGPVRTQLAEATDAES